MKFRVVDRVSQDADAVGVAVFEGRLDGAGDPDFLAGCGFGGALGQTAVLAPQSPGGPARIVVGLGEPERLDLGALRRAADRKSVV